MTDKEKDPYKNIREIARRRFFEGLRSRRLKEMDEGIKNIEEQHEERMLTFVRSLPLLPPGWKYEFEYEMIYNEEMKTYNSKLIATPRQMYKIEEDKK